MPCQTALSRPHASRLIYGVGGQASCFKVNAVANHYNAIEGQAGFGTLIDRVVGVIAWSTVAFVHRSGHTRHYPLHPSTS